jgi:putative DNA primase/helicase
LTKIFNGPWTAPPQRIDPPEEQLIEAISDAGLEPPEQVFLDGKIHRFRSGQKRDKTGWYVAFSDGIPAGRFGDWREDINQPWTAEIGRPLTFDEIEARKRHVKAKRIRDPR